MEPTGIAVIAIGGIAFALVSARLDGTIVTAPPVFVAFGWAIGPGGLSVADIDPEHGSSILLPK